jgi:hypothetical protein
MKSILRGWRKFLVREGLEHYNVVGRLRLYHYSKADDDSLTLDPEYFLTNRSEYTRRDHTASDLPRVFFYANLDHAENIIKQGRTLYTTFVDASKVYDINKDSKSLSKNARRWPVNMHGEPMKDRGGAMDYDLLLRSVAGKPGKGMELVSEEHHPGAYYTTGQMDVVVWFEPIEVHKFNPENVDSPTDSAEGE